MCAYEIVNVLVSSIKFAKNNKIFILLFLKYTYFVNYYNNI